MSNFKKLLIAGVALASMSGVANATVSATAVGTPYIAGGTPSGNLTLTGASFTVNAATLQGTATSANFAALFTAGNTVTITLNQGNFASAPGVLAYSDAGCTTSVAAPTFSAGGSGSNFVSFALTASPNIQCITINGIVVSGVTQTGTANSISLTVSSPQPALAGVPSAALTAAVASFAAPVAVAFAPVAVPLSSNNQTFNAGGTSAALGTATFDITAVNNYDGTPVTYGTPTVSLSLPNFVVGSLGQPSAAGTNAFATLSPANPGTDGSVAITGVAALAADSTITPSITDAASTALAIGRGAVTLTYSVPVTNNSGAPATFSGSGTIGTITTTPGTADFAIPYAVGSDTAFGFFVNVSTGANAGRVRAEVNGFSTQLTSSQAAGTSVLYDIATIRSGLIANGAPASTLADSGSRARIIISAPAGTKVNPLVLNRSGNLVTEVGGGSN